VQPLSMQRLESELNALRAENMTLKQRLQLWENYHAGRGATLSNPSPSPGVISIVSNAPAALTPTDTAAAPARGNPAARTSVPRTTARTHTIVAGDTPTGIARRYNIKLSALESANPRMDARRLRPGQTLVIPPP